MGEQDAESFSGGERPCRDDETVREEGAVSDKDPVESCRLMRESKARGEPRIDNWAVRSVCLGLVLGEDHSDELDRHPCSLGLVTAGPNDRSSWLGPRDS